MTILPVEPDSEIGKLLEINPDIFVKDGLPADIKSILTGTILDGLLGAMDSVVFNKLKEIPPSVQDLLSVLLSKVLEKSNISEPTKDILNSFVSGGSIEYFEKLAKLSPVIKMPSRVLDGLNDTTKMLQQFSSLASFAIPGANIVSTASTVLSMFGNKSDVLSLAGQGIGLSGAIGVFGSQSAVLSSLVAPSAGAIFKGIGVGGSDPRTKCPCLDKCRKLDHFISESGTVLLTTCAPVLMSSFEEEGLV